MSHRRLLPFCLGLALFISPPLVRAQPYTDAFTRANNVALGGSWVEREDVTGFCDGVLQVVSNQLYTHQCTNGGFAYWNGTFEDNQYSKLKYGGADGNADLGGPAVRIHTDGQWFNASFYMADYDRFNSVIRLVKLQPGHDGQHR
jgi:hypothetical protein